MKKTIIIAAAFAALLSCTKDNQPQNEGEGNDFKKGQQVTLDVTAGDPGTKVTSNFDSDGKTVDFKWQDGDKIKVTVGTEFAEFTLASGADTKSATFTGIMPASGSSFDVQYPVTNPDITTQAYSSTEKIPHDKMKLAATGCTLGTSFSLEAQNAVLRLNLWGTSQTVTEIVVKNKTSSKTYTLTMDPAVTLPTTEAAAQAFFIVVPAGSYDFSAAINNIGSYTIPDSEYIIKSLFSVKAGSNCILSTTSARTFTAGEILNMDAKEVTATPPTKVCFSSGNLYYSTTDKKYHIEAQQNVTYATLGQSTYDATHVCHFFWSNITDWQTTGKEPWAQTYSNPPQSTSDKFFCGIDNPMEVDGQSGLYALTGGTGGEWDYLINSRDNASSLYKFGVSVETSAGAVNSCLVIAPDACLNSYTFDNTKTSYTAAEWATAEAAGLVCLPAAGYRYASFLYYDGYRGDYWSATPCGGSEYYAYSLSLSSNYVGPVWNGNRYFGYSVRLVCAAQ